MNNDQSQAKNDTELKELELEEGEDTFVFSKKSGANLVLTSHHDGTLKITFGDLEVEVTAVHQDWPLAVSTNGEVSG
jgi:hypothetical protein